MTMVPFAHANATTVADTVGALSATCRPLAGGTDLLGLMKSGLATPKQLVNLKTLEELSGVHVGTDGWRIGALTTLSALAEDPALTGRPEVACLTEAVLASASPQLRHMATLGGNLLQKPRCWYYRNPLTRCWRKGGQTCYAFRGRNKYHVILEGGPCYAVHPSDPAVALLAMDATVTLVGPDGSREIPLAEMYRLPSRQSRENTALAAEELITEITVPMPPDGVRSAYVKVAERATWDFALVSVAVQIRQQDGVVERARIALGGVATIPWLAEAAEEALVGRPLSEETIGQAAAAAVQDAKPLADNGYKVELVQSLIRQAVAEAVAG